MDKKDGNPRRILAHSSCVVHTDSFAQESQTNGNQEQVLNGKWEWSK